MGVVNLDNYIADFLSVELYPWTKRIFDNALNRIRGTNQDLLKYG